MYKGIKNISEETYISAFVYGLEPQMWAIVPAEEAERMLADYDGFFELVPQSMVEEILGNGTRGATVVGVAFKDRRPSTTAKEDDEEKPTEESGLTSAARGRPPKK